MEPVNLELVLVGAIAPLSVSDPRPSGIDKHPVFGRVWLGRAGLEGDAQGDREAHGGFDKAVHHYALEHYPHWREELPHADVRLRTTGAFGENFSTRGWTEQDICLGDVIEVGTAKVEVSHGRQPCSKLNTRFATADMSVRVTRTGRSGWYYRVVEEGFVSAGDPMTIVARPHPEWTIARLFAALFGPPPFDDDGLQQLEELPVLAHAWKVRLGKRRRKGSPKVP